MHSNLTIYFNYLLTFAHLTKVDFDCLCIFRSHDLGYHIYHKCVGMSIAAYYMCLFGSRSTTL